MKRASAIVGVLLFVVVCALCADFITQTRAVAALTSCTNNLKQIGMSVHGFAGTYRELPRTTAWRMTQGKQAEFPIEKQASWLYDVSPFVEARMDPKFRIDATLPMDAEENRYVVESVFAVYLCAANSDRGPNENFTHYVGFTGIGRDADMLPLSDPRCGFFGYKRKTTFADIKDGTATTLAIVETATDNGPWALGGHATVRGLVQDGTDYLGEHGQFNSGHFVKNQPFRRSCVTQAGFADGSVRMLTTDLAPEVFEALATIAGGEAVPPIEP